MVNEVGPTAGEALGMAKWVVSMVAVGRLVAYTAAEAAELGGAMEADKVASVVVEVETAAGMEEAMVAVMVAVMAAARRARGPSGE